MSRRRRNSAAVSFFAFQDVMIGVIGVVLIITLILLIQVGRRTSEAIAATQDSQQLAEVERLEARLAMLDALPNVESQAAELARLQVVLDIEAIRNQHRGRMLADLGTQRMDEQRDRLQSGDLQAIDRMSVEANLLRKEIAEERRRHEISYLLDDEHSNAVIAELTAERVVVSSIRAGEAPIAVTTSDPERLARITLDAWLARSASGPTHLLLSLKPSGIAVWNAIERIRRTDPRLKDLTIGVDLIAEDATTTRQFRAAEPTP
jgi:hypothetical protein